MPLYWIAPSPYLGNKVLHRSLDVCFRGFSLILCRSHHTEACFLTLSLSACLNLVTLER
jgi:hypothetical protein